jgi:alpha-1,2-mannosyltransferase
MFELRESREGISIFARICVTSGRSISYVRRMANEFNLPSWVTAKRLRAQGLVLALCLWSIYVWNISATGLRDRHGLLKGTDFVHLYTLGSLAFTHRGADLYDMHAQTALVQRIQGVPDIVYLPLYPPQVSVFFSPLARFSYGWALVIWLTVTAAIYAYCCYAVWRVCPNLRSDKFTIFILAAAYPAFFHLVLWGQTSALALACFTLAYFALRTENYLLAGIALGTLAFKPQLGLAAAILFVGMRNWTLIAGAILSAAAQFVLAWLYFGLAPLRQWLRMLRNVPKVLALLEPRPYQTHSLRAFWGMLVPSPTVALLLYIVSAVFVLALLIWCWRSQLSLGVRYSALLVGTALVAPHLTVYDLVILAPAFLLLGDWVIANGRHHLTLRLAALLYLIYLLPLVGPLARWTRLQLSVLAMSAIIWTLWQLAKTSTPELGSTA